MEPLPVDVGEPDARYSPARPDVEAAAASSATANAAAAVTMIVERRLSAHIDWPLIIAVVSLALVGLTTIYWSPGTSGTISRVPQFWTQVYALPVALRRDAGVPADRLPHADAAVALHLRRC